MNRKYDLTNKRFGKLTAQKLAKDGSRSWVCICDCGKEVVVPTILLRSGKRTNCGCEPELNKFELVGQRFGMLTVIKFGGYGVGNRQQWVCKCDCGNEVTVYIRYLQRGSRTDCGCQDNVKKIRPRTTQYGESACKRVISYYKNNADKKGIPFELSDDRMKELFQGNCYYCGDAPSNIMSHESCYGPYIYNGIDRLDPSVGYVEGNVVSCCQTCNFIKNKYTDKQFLDIVSKIAKRHNL